MRKKTILLSVPEQQLLDDMEVKIEAGLDKAKIGNYEAGVALKKIKDTGVWAYKYSSFESYVKERWGLDRQTAWRAIEFHQDIKAIEATTGGVDKSITTPLHAKEVVAVPPEKRKEVLELANELAADKGSKVAANTIKQAAKDILEPEEELETIMTPAASHARDVDVALENGKSLKEIVKAVREVVKLIKAVPNGPGTDDFVSRKQSTILMAEQLISGIVVSIPHAECPVCNGNRCAQCGNTGWINKSLAKEYKDKQTTELQDVGF